MKDCCHVQNCVRRPFDESCCFNRWQALLKREGLSNAAVDGLAVAQESVGSEGQEEEEEGGQQPSKSDYDVYVLDVVQWSLIGVLGTLGVQPRH